MKECADLFNDALLSSTGMGSWGYEAIRRNAVHFTAKELTGLMQRTLDAQGIFDLEHFYQYIKIRLQQGWPGVYGGTEIILRSSALYQEHMEEDVRKIMERALRSLYKQHDAAL